MISFSSPYLALIGFILTIVFLKFQKGNYFGYSFVNFFKFKKSRLSIFLSYLPKIIVYFIIGCMFLALSQPKIKNKNVYKKILTRDIVIVVDLSWSMEKDNKLKNIKTVIINFLKERKNDRISLMVFGDNVFGIYPLTTDKQIIMNKVSQLGKVYEYLGGTNIVRAIEYSLNYVINNSTVKNPIVIIASDGEAQFSNEESNILVNQINERKIHFYWIEVGPHDYEYSNPTESIERLIGQVKNGKTFKSSNKEILSKIFNEINQIEEQRIVKESVSKYYNLYPYILIFTAFILVGFVIIRGFEL